MPDLTRIPDLQESLLELLEVAGVSDLEALSTADAKSLTAELGRANGVLKLAAETPDQDAVAGWVREARKLTGKPDLSEVLAALPANYEEKQEVLVMLASAPFAIPLPARHLVEKKVGVGEIPVGILLNQYPGDLDVRVAERVAAPKVVKNPAAGYVQVAEPVMQRLEVNTARMKTTEDFEAVPRIPKSLPAVEPSVVEEAAPKGEDRVALIRAPREKTNRGVAPESRRYVRGVLHSHPKGLAFGAVISLLVMLVLPLAIVSGILLLLSDQVPETFGWVPPWVLAFPAALPLLGLLYLIFGVSGSCRICGQKLFVPKACRKNIKAHHVPGLGYIVPVALHMLFFRWFRCTYCGTPVRLKK